MNFGPKENLPEIGAVSQDGMLAATINKNSNNVDIWNIQPLQKLSTIPTSAAASDIGFSPDKRKIWVLLSRTIEVWNIESRSLLYSVPCDLAQAFDSIIRFSSDGKYLIAINSLGSTKPIVYDAENGNLVREIPITDSEIFLNEHGTTIIYDSGVKINRHGRLPRIAKFWNVADGTLIKSIDGIFALSKQKNAVLTYTRDFRGRSGKFTIYRADTFETLVEIHDEKFYFDSNYDLKIDLSSDLKTISVLMIGSISYSKLILIDVPSKTLSYSGSDSLPSPSSADFSADSKYLIVNHGGSWWQLSDLKSGININCSSNDRICHKKRGHAYFLKNLPTVAFWYQDDSSQENKLKLYHLRTDIKDGQLVNAANGVKWALGWEKKFKTTFDSCTYLFEGFFNNECKLIRIPLSEGHFSGYTHAGKISPDGLMVATTSSGDEIAKIWSTATGKYITGLSHTKGSSQREVKFSHDSRYLFTYSDHRISIWDIYKRLLLKTIDREAPILDVEPSTFGPYFLFWTAQGEAELWNTDKLSLIKKVKASHLVQKYLGQSQFFSEDGRLFLTHSDRKVNILDVETGTIQKTLDRHPGEVVYGSFASGNRAVVATKFNIYIYDIVSGYLMNIISRDPTDDYCNHGFAAAFMFASGAIGSIRKCSSDPTSSSQTVDIWRLRTDDSQYSGSFLAHGFDYKTLSFIPIVNDNLLLLMNYDTNVRNFLTLYDVSEGKTILTVPRDTHDGLLESSVDRNGGLLFTLSKPARGDLWKLR